MGNQSFFSPKNKTRTWAFLHAHLGNGPLPPLAIKRAALYLKCTVRWGVHAKIPIQFNILKLLPLFSTSSRFQNLTLGWHFSISRPSLFSVCQFTVFSFLSVWMPFLTVYCWVLLDLHLAQGLGWHVSCWFNFLLCVSLFIFLFCIFSKWCEMKLNILWNIC